ncbi:MAG TPA: YncE family protein [Bacteroidota bacterium]|nr:YncE family protein [Bacteroidota bacterium]
MRKRHWYHPLLLVALMYAWIGCRDTEKLTAPPDYGEIGTIVYSSHIQPILERSCALSGCHDAVSKAAGLSLASWNQLIKGSTHGEVVVPFTPARSLLTLLFAGTPLRKQHPAISLEAFTMYEVRFLERWIAEGARNDSGIVPYRGAGRKLYVPNQGDDNVAIIDIDSLVVTRYIGVGRSPVIEGPHFVVANDRFWYVSLVGAGQVWKFDALADTLVGYAKIQGMPALLELTPDGSKLYVSQFTTSMTNKVIVVNTSTMTVVNSITVWTMPHGMRMNHTGTKLYVANMMSDNISVIGLQDDEVITTIPLASDAMPFGPAKYMPMEICISPDDSILMVTCSETQEVRMFDAVRYTLIDSFIVGDQPWHLQFTPDGQFCYVANRRGNSASMIHAPMRHVMETIAGVSLFDYPHGCDVSVDGKYVFVSNENVGHRFTPRYNTDYVGNVCVIDGATNQIVKVLEVGKMPTGLSVAR